MMLRFIHYFCAELMIQMKEIIQKMEYFVAEESMIPRLVAEKSFWLY